MSNKLVHEEIRFLIKNLELSDHKKILNNIEKISNDSNSVDEYNTIISELNEDIEGYVINVIDIVNKIKKRTLRISKKLLKEVA